MEVHVEGGGGHVGRDQNSPFHENSNLFKGVFCTFMKNPTLNLLDAYDFLKVHFLMNKLKTRNLYVILT